MRPPHLSISTFARLQVGLQQAKLTGHHPNACHGWRPLPKSQLVLSALSCLQVGLQQAELTGYHPKRKEFEPEYDNDAESLIADLDFRDEDTEVQFLQSPLPRVPPPPPFPLPTPLCPRGAALCL